jgi:hypothetical protein
MEDIDYVDWPEELVVSELRAGKITALIYFYETYREDLLIFTYTRLYDREAADTTVEEVFVDLWMKYRYQEITLPIYGFLILQVEAMISRLM